MPGILDRFGSFGQKLIRLAQQTGTGVSSLFDVADIVGVDVSSADVTREWGQVRTTTELESAVSAVPLEDYIPKELYVPRDPPFNRPYAYLVRFYGRDLEGRFAAKEYNLTFSKEVRPGDIMDVAAERFGVGGEYSELMDIYDMSVVTAYTRPGESR